MSWLVTSIVRAACCLDSWFISHPSMTQRGNAGGHHIWLPAQCWPHNLFSFWPISLSMRRTVRKRVYWEFQSTLAKGHRPRMCHWVSHFLLDHRVSQLVAGRVDIQTFLSEIIDITTTVHVKADFVFSISSNWHSWLTTTPLASSPLGGWSFSLNIGDVGVWRQWVDLISLFFPY